MRGRNIGILAVIFVWLVSTSLGAQTSTSDPAESHYPISQTELQTSLQEIETLLNTGAYLEAKTRYQTLAQYDLSEEDRKLIRKNLDDLNLKILFSPTLTPDSFHYTVEKGDSLYEIAKKHHTTVELVRKSNSLSTDTIRPGMKLKISKAVFSIVVDVSENQLTLLQDQELLKTYSVATGRAGHETPLGTFKIVNKLVDPVWYKTGAVVPTGSPENILGSRWLGFSLEGYGIHGTTLPETIGAHTSEGCVRMHNRDVEEIYTIVPIPTSVTVRD